MAFEARNGIQHDKLLNPNLEWTLLDKLGEGTYGQVYRAKYINSNATVAVKIVRIQNDDTSSDFENELNILKNISKQQENLPNFIGIYGDCDSFKVPRIWLIMEICSLGPVGRLLKNIEKKTHITKLEKEKLIAFALQSTLKALKYLHESGIMHRDVKGSHILATDDYQIKLIDFGVAGLFNSERTKRNSSVGTSLWMAPEVIACANQLDYEYDERCDIWSVGITAIELADGEAPLANLHPTKVLFEVPRRPPPTLNEPTEWSEDLLKFISNCLVKDYEKRPKASDLLINDAFVNFTETISQNYRHLLEKYHKQNPISESTLEKSVESEQSVVLNDDNQNPWIENISKSASFIDRENNLAQLDSLDQKRLMDSIRRRFNKTLIYTYIGDVLLAINPKQFLPIDNLNFQLKYLKIRQDLLPHVFAIATNVYNQMMISRQAQCIILSGESGSGKTHAAQNLISELALLGFGEQRALENRLVSMNLLLESFGNAQTIRNNNSSRFGKLLEIFFSEYGTIVYVQLSEFLLEKTRVVLAGNNQRNFHIFYSIYSHFSSTNKLDPCQLNDQQAFDLFQSIDQYTYLGKNNEHILSSLSLENLFEIFKELNLTDDEQASILAILTSIIHLGNISFQSQNEITEPGCSIDEQTLVHFDAVYRLLKIDSEQFKQSLCQSSLMTRGETVTKLNTIAEAQQTRDAMAKSLYSRLFDWIIFALNRYFRTELEYKPKSVHDIRKRHERDLFNNAFSIRTKTSEELIQRKRDDNEILSSISILDLFGFENFENNSYEQLCINIANEQLQYFFRQHTFAWEMKEYENEGIDMSSNTIEFHFPNNRSILDMCLSKPIGLLALLDEESRFPQSTEFTLVNKWRENLNSPHFNAMPLSASLSKKSLRRQRLDYQAVFTIHHYAAKIEYSAKDFLEKNRDYVPMEIIDLLLQSQDHLVSILFRSRLRNNGSVIYSEQTTYFRSSANQKTATGNRTQGTVSTYFRYSLMELVSAMASAQPTFVRCLVPNRFPSKITHLTYDHTSYFPQNFTFDSSQFDESVVLEQIRYSGLLETIEIRRYGFSHRILYEDFVSMYSCLIDFKQQPIDNHRTCCERILKEFQLTNYALGKTKVFLKFHHIERLNLAHKHLLNKLIRIQSHIRMFLIRKQKSSVEKPQPTEHERSIARLQAMVRGFLVRKHQRRESRASLTIQAYWRMWYERAKYKRERLHHRNEQIQISYFLKQIELFGNHAHQQLTQLKEINEYSSQSSNDEQKASLPKITKPISKILPNSTRRKVAILCEYYDHIYKEFMNKKNQKTIEEPKEDHNHTTLSQRPSTAPLLNSDIPQAPPCPPPEFFKQTSNEVRIPKRQTSAPATIRTPIDELKHIFATRIKQPTDSAISVLSFRPVSLPPTPDQSLLTNRLNVNSFIQRDERLSQRRRLSSSSSSSNVVKPKTPGLLSSSTSSLVGDMVLKPEDVLKLKENLRKTGLVDKNQTLRRKLPSETTQIDFRGILRPAKTNRMSTKRNT